MIELKNRLSENAEDLTKEVSSSIANYMEEHEECKDSDVAQALVYILEDYV